MGGAYVLGFECSIWSASEVSEEYNGRLRMVDNGNAAMALWQSGLELIELDASSVSESGLTWMIFVHALDRSILGH